MKRPVLHSLSSNVLEKNDRNAMKFSHKKRSPLFKENSPISKNSTYVRNISQVKRNLQFGNITAEVKKDIFPMFSEKLSQSLANTSYNTFMFNKAGSNFYRVQNSQVSYFRNNAHNFFFNVQPFWD